MSNLRIGIDTGGTFTDFVLIREGRIKVFKELSTPQHPELAILSGLETAAAKKPSEIIHGSTVATNALLERKGARTALVTTAGFEDVLVIGRQTRPELYDMLTSRPEPLIPKEWRIGLEERTLHDGKIEKRLNSKEIRKLLRLMRSSGIESIAVSLLYSFVNPEHERKIGLALEELGIPVSLSSEIMPEYREFERTSTTSINAYLAPVMSQYLGRLESKISGSPLRVMQSNGGAIKARVAMASPVRTILSGPAGGVVGAFFLAQKTGYSNIITFDMGGTSTDVSLCDEEVRVTHESEVAGMPIGIPMMDIHTVGAGGGSIAQVDKGGALRVGPESAGANPGPICYGKGDALTVTDANVILGRLLPRFFLGGTMPLAENRIPEVLNLLGWVDKWPSPEQLAQGVIDVVNNNMEQAIRLISVERGYDPRDFALICFGGAGGLHAATVARGLGIPRIVVPPHPGALSALGLLLADARKDYSRTLLGVEKLTEPKIKKNLTELHRVGVKELCAEGFKRADITIFDALDVRYLGQSYELTIPFSGEWQLGFHNAHELRYGYANPDSPLEVVSARTTLFGQKEKPRIKKTKSKSPNPKPVEVSQVWFDGGWSKTKIYERDSLKYGNVIRGPAIVGEYSSTTLVPPDYRCEVDQFGNLVLIAS